MSEIIWFPRLLCPVGSVGECSRVFFLPFFATRLDNHGWDGVYARARAPHALYIYRTQQQQQQPIYTYTYILHLLGFERAILGLGRVALVRARDTPCNDEKSSQKLGATFYDIHNSSTESITPNLSYPQAQRWKSAKTKTRHAIQSGGAIFFKPVTRPIWLGMARHLETVGTTPKQRHSTMAAME